MVLATVATSKCKDELGGDWQTEASRYLSGLLATSVALGHAGMERCSGRVRLLRSVSSKFSSGFASDDRIAASNGAQVSFFHSS